MNNARLRLQALLHDPPQKACALFTHELWADWLLRRIGLELPTSDDHPVRRADRMAAGADRVNLPKRDPWVFFKEKPEIIHPLSGWTIRLSSIEEVGTLNLETIAHRAMDRLVERALAGKPGGEAEYRWLADLVWRGLADALKDVERRGNLGILWDWLPADTRIPDHTIWDHQRLASAFALAGDRPALLAFFLGPVQPFIEGGRKLADLFGASLILSRASWAAMKKVAEELAPESIVFPDLRGQPVADAELNVTEEKPGSRQLDVPSLPNRFLALVPYERGREIAEAARQASLEAIHDALEGALEDALDKALEEFDRSLLDRACCQVDSFFEFAWVAVPWPENVKAWQENAGKAGIPTSDLDQIVERLRQHDYFAPSRGSLYGELFRVSGRLVGGLKAARRFEAAAEPGWKCSSCGEREPLPFPGEKAHREDLRTSWSGIRGKNPGLARKGEFLCAVCLLRRRGHRAFLSSPEADRFPSTANVAAAPWIREVCRKALESPKVLEVVRDLARIARDLAPAEVRARAPWRIYREFGGDPILQLFLHLDARLFYEETYESKDFEQEIGPEAVEKLRRAAGSLLEAMGSKPDRYFAVIAADGDRMGKLLTADTGVRFSDVIHSEVRNQVPQHVIEDLDRLPRPTSPAFHATVSRILKDFSIHIVPHLVEECRDGDLVYAGGDDLLAMAPPLEAMAVADDVRRAWSGVDPEDCGDDSAREFKLGDWWFAKGYARRGEKLCLVMGPRHSLSAGIAVAHYKAPLAETLRAAREALEKAKESGRDALGLALLKRSGEHTVQALSWRVPAKDRTIRAADLLKRLAAAFAKPLSPRLVAALQRFEPPPEKQWSSPFDALFLKHFSDHCQESGKKDVGALAGDILAFGRGGGFRDKSWKAVLDFVRAGAFLARMGGGHE